MYFVLSDHCVALQIQKMVDPFISEFLKMEEQKA